MNDDAATSPTNPRYHIAAHGNNSWKVDLVSEFAADIIQRGFVQGETDADGWLKFALGEMVISVSPNGSVSCKGRMARTARVLLNSMVAEVRQRYLAEVDSLPLTKRYRMFKNSASGWQLRPMPGQTELEAVAQFTQHLATEGYTETERRSPEYTSVWRAFGRNADQQVITISYTWLLHVRGAEQRTVAAWLDSISFALPAPAGTEQSTTG